MRWIRSSSAIVLLAVFACSPGDLVAPDPALGDAAVEQAVAQATGADVETTHWKSQRAPRGLVVVRSTKGVQQTGDDLLAALQNNPALTVVADLDHAANAARVGQRLLPTREIFFGNPNLGTPLMQATQTTGIDLPQKMLIWEEADGSVFVAYNSVRYLQTRHKLWRVRDQLKTIQGALATLAGVATGTEAAPARGGGVFPRSGLRFVRSEFSADETFKRLTTAIEVAPPLTILFQLEHDANAARVGLKLRPTKLVVFGNPALGTPLMQTVRSVGIDLPQKFLVVETRRGGVYIAYNDPFYVARRHGIRGRDTELNTIAGALATLAKGAAQAAP